MSQLRLNIVFNLAGKIISALTAIVFAPLYVRYLGVEAYGLVGFYTALQPILFLVDMGLSTTLNRELARLSAQSGTAQIMRDNVRTLELVYWFFALLIVLVGLSIAPMLSHHWIQSHHLSQTSVCAAVRMMSIAIGLQFPFALYQGGLLGLQRQWQLNLLLAGSSLFRAGGALFVLARLSATPAAFFSWQIVASALTTVIGGLMLWWALPRTERRSLFSIPILRSIWRFAAGMTGISVTAVVLTQLDKIVLSRMLPLKEFGYYSLASLVASSLSLLVTPVFAAVFPRFCQLVSEGAEADLISTYHQTSSIVSVIVIPVGTVLAMFSAQVMFAWTGKPEIVENTHVVVALLVVGNMINSLQYTPYALQLANGWTKLAFSINALAICVQLPSLLFATAKFGAIGAASVWTIFAPLIIVVTMFWMHKRLLSTELSKWYIDDVARPALAAVCVSAISYVFARTITGRLEIFIVLSLTVLAAMIASAFASSSIGPYILRGVQRLKGRVTGC